MRRRLLVWLALIVAAFACQASATAVEYSVASLGGIRWQFAYTLTNGSLATAIEEFSIFFDPQLFANLVVESSPPGWDSIVLQPSPAIPAEGLFDSLAIVSGIPPSGTLTGYSTSFDFLGTGTPNSQRFEVVDPQTFEVLDNGRTTALVVQPPNGVDVPPTVFLVLLALALFAMIGVTPQRVRRPV